MTDNKTEIATQNYSVFANPQSFEIAQRMVKPLAESSLVPNSYKGKIGDCLIALDIAQRTGSNVLAVMQNLYIVHGRPAWSSTFIIAAINQSGKFSQLEFEYEDLGEKELEYYETEWIGKEKSKKLCKVKVQDRSCRAVAKSKATGTILYGSKITMEMAVKEGWYGKDGSKWQTMPEQMLAYRAATFFGRLYIPEILMGMPTEDEIMDIEDKAFKAAKDVTPNPLAEELTERFSKALEPEVIPAKAEIIKPEVKQEVTTGKTQYRASDFPELNEEVDIFPNQPSN